VHRFLREWLEVPGRLQSQVINKAWEWLDAEGDKALGDWDISRDPPYFAFAFPTSSKKNISTYGSTRRSATSRA